ncbi:MAG TPA: sulfatase, partial [Bacteroidales bacterium]|nr:sulfatase [Bacteroidales bacterium]
MPSVKLMIAAGMSTLAVSCSNVKKVPEQPNIIYIMADDHAYQALSCYGSKINETPNLDRIANEGMLFMNSFVTNSICSPSRAVLLTGKYSHINGQLTNKNTFDGDQETFPKLLQKAGYQTAMIGKWHLRSEPQGFDYWNILPGQGVYYNPEFIENGTKKQVEGYVTNLTTDFALKWLKNRDESRPFCLLFHQKAPHRPWLPDTTDLYLYEDETIPMPGNFFDDYSNRGTAAKTQEMRVDEVMTDCWDLKLCQDVPDTVPNGMERGWGYRYRRMNPAQREAWDKAFVPRNKAFYEANLTGRELSKWKYQRYIKNYLRCIHSVDRNVGRLLDYLKESGLDKNTIVIYTSDQGFYLGEHGWFDKRFMYEESFRMPLMIKYPPLVKAGTRNTDMVMNVDFAPTILDFAGVAVPEDMQGRSMKEVLEGNTPGDWRTTVYYHYFEYPAAHMVKRHYGVRDKRYKLIHFYYDVD